MSKDEGDTSFPIFRMLKPAKDRENNAPKTSSSLAGSKKTWFDRFYTV